MMRNHRNRDDQGFTLAELMMAMGIFVVLMAIVSVVMLTGFSAIRGALNQSSDLSDAQNSAEWISREFRYMAVPEGLTTSVTEATQTGMTFYTYSGTGPKLDVPYKVRIYTVTAPDGSKTVQSDVITPTKSDIGWTWPATGTTRILMRIKAGAPAPLTFRMWTCDSLTGCLTVSRELTLPSTGIPTFNTGEIPQSVAFTVGNTSTPGQTVTQHLRLVNLT
jgi:prepilin-type N-terminal cleavage/methylation domain-containing protein